MKDGQSLVRAGDNRYHAIFMTEGNALFVAPSSLAVPLIALGATATLQGPKGERTVKVEELYQVPRKDGDSELTIRDDEVLTKVSIPAPKGTNASYEARQKRAHDWPLVLASVNIETDGGGKVAKARLILGSVAPIPLRSEAAEKAITGKAITMETAAAAAEAAVAGAKPLSMNGYKVALTGPWSSGRCWPRPATATGRRPEPLTLEWRTGSAPARRRKRGGRRLGPLAHDVGLVCYSRPTGNDHVGPCRVSDRHQKRSCECSHESTRRTVFALIPKKNRENGTFSS